MSSEANQSGKYMGVDNSGMENIKSSSVPINPFKLAALILKQFDIMSKL